MKKSAAVLLVVAVAGAAYAGSSWYFGKRAQAVIESSVAQLNTSLAGVQGQEMAYKPLQVGVQSYERGWFSSNVVYRLAGPEGVELVLEDHLEHGPFPWSNVQQGQLQPVLGVSQAKLSQPASLGDWKKDAGSVDAWLRAATSIDMAGNINSLITLAPLTLRRAGETLTFSGGDLTLNMAGDFSLSTLSGGFDHLNLTDAELQQTIESTGIRLESAYRSSEGQPVTSQGKATIARVAITETDVPQVIVAENTVISYDSSQLKTLADGAVRYEIGRLLFGKENLGSLSLGMKIARLDTAAFADLITYYESISAGLDDDAQFTPEQEAGMHKRLLALLASRPALSFDPVLWSTPAGESRLLAQVDFVQPAQSDAMDAGSALVQALGRVRFEASVSRPMLVYLMEITETDPQARAEMAEAGGLLFDEYVTALAAEGYVTLDGDTARAAITYEGETVSINELKMPAADFLQLIFLMML